MNTNEVEKNPITQHNVGGFQGISLSLAASWRALYLDIGTRKPAQASIIRRSEPPAFLGKLCHSDEVTGLKGQLRIVEPRVLAKCFVHWRETKREKGGGGGEVVVWVGRGKNHEECFSK